MTRKTATAKAETLPLLDDSPKAATPPTVIEQPAQRRQPVAVRDDAPPNMLAVIASAAANKNVDASKMRELLEMQKEIMAEESRIAFNTAFIAMQAELPVINATGRIEIREKVGGERIGKVQQSTPYATFNEINRVTKPILQRHEFGLSFATEPTPDGNRLNVIGVLDHIRGHSRRTVFPLPAETSGSKNNVQGWGSSLSYGKRYCTIALLNIVSAAFEDVDDDGNGGGAETTRRATLTIDQSTELVELIKSSGVGLDRFLEKYQVKAVIDLDPKLFNEAKAACQNYKAAKGSK